MPQPLVPWHLKVLRERGMINSVRHGTGVVYSLANSIISKALDLLHAAMREIMTKRAALVGSIGESSPQ